MITQKIRRFAKKVFNSKAWVIAFINRFLPEEFGKLEELIVNRDEKMIYMDVSKEAKSSSLHVKRYAMRYEGSKSFVTFEDIAVEGYLKPQLATLSKTREIEVDPKYITLVKKLLKA